MITPVRQSVLWINRKYITLGCDEMVKTIDFCLHPCNKNVTEFMRVCYGIFHIVNNVGKEKRLDTAILVSYPTTGLSIQKKFDS